MKKLALLGFFFAFLTVQLEAQTQGSYLTIQTIVPTDTISVCLDTFQITINITNDFLVTIDSLAVEHIFPGGIFFTGDFTGADSVDVSNPNVPVFFIDSITGNGFASITLSAFANCDFVDSIAADTTVVDYQVGANLFFQQDISNSYNVESADLSITAPVVFPVANIGDDGIRSIIIFNGGFGAVDTVILTIDLEPELEIIGYYIAGNPIPYDTTGGIITIILADSLIALGTQNGDSLFEHNEGIEITEYVSVVSCTPPAEPETDYIVSWGCSGQTCQSVEANANVTVKAYEPIIKVTTDTTFTPTNYCTTDTGTLNFTYTNTANTFVVPGDAVATDLVVVVRWDRAFVDIMDIRIDGAPVSGIPGIGISGIQNAVGNARDSTFFYDLSAVPASFSFPGGNIIDIDRDGFVDDLVEQRSFPLSVDYRLSCDTGLQECRHNLGLLITGNGFGYKDQCGGNEVTYGVTTSNGAWIAYSTGTFGKSFIELPPDVEEASPFIMTVCPSFNQRGIDRLNCPSDSFLGVLQLPPGYNLKNDPDTVTFAFKYGPTSSLIDTMYVPASQLGDSVFFEIGSMPIPERIKVTGCFDLELELTCDTTIPLSGFDDFFFGKYIIKC